jgi:hypothetical protein
VRFIHLSPTSGRRWHATAGGYAVARGIGGGKGLLTEHPIGGAGLPTSHQTRSCDHDHRNGSLRSPGLRDHDRRNTHRGRCVAAFDASPCYFSRLHHSSDRRQTEHAAPLDLRRPFSIPLAVEKSDEARADEKKREGLGHRDFPSMTPMTPVGAVYGAAVTKPLFGSKVVGELPT